MSSNIRIFLDCVIAFSPEDYNPRNVIVGEIHDSFSAALAAWRPTKIYSLRYFKIGSNVRYPLFGLLEYKTNQLKEA